MNDEREDTRIGVLRWILDVLYWDGLFPAALFAISFVAARILPNNNGITTLMVLALPIAGVFTRFTIGYRKIHANSCGTWLRYFQIGCLGIAVLIFMFFDFFIVVGAFANQPGPIAHEDKMVFLVMVSIYVCLVTVAMYPGLRHTEEQQSWLDTSRDPHEILR